MDTKALRQKILDLAIHGKLVPQDPNDEPASVLLQRIREEKERLIKEGKIKKGKKSAKTSEMGQCEDAPFEVPSSWEWATIGDIFTLQAGRNVAAANINANQTTEYKYPCYGGNGIRGYVANANRNGDYPIIGRQGALCGNINLARGEFYATEHAVVVDRYDNTDLMWSYYTLVSLNLNQYATATAQPGLAVNIINEVYIPLPPLAEQHRIVSAINRWFSLIDLIESGKTTLHSAIKQAKSKILDLAIHGRLVPQDPNDEPASELLRRINPKAEIASDKAQFGEVPFDVPSSWEWTTIGDIAESNIGLTYKPTDICVDGVPVYRSNNIINGRIDTDELVRVSTRILDKQFLNIGDLLICARNGSRRLVGKCALIEELTEPTSFGAFMAVCRSQYNHWINLLLNTTYFDRYLDSSNSATINQLTQSMLLAFRIPLPPLPEQHRIVSKIEALFAQLDRIEAEL